MKKIYTEIGYGNDTFLNTEVETWKDGKEISEYRIKRFLLPKKIKNIYLRIWINKKVYIFSSKGFRVKKKERKELKILFGIGGEELRNSKYDKKN